MKIIFQMASGNDKTTLHDFSPEQVEIIRKSILGGDRYLWISHIDKRSKAQTLFINLNNVDTVLFEEE